MGLLAHAELVRAQLAYAAGKGDDAQPLLLTAARRLEPIDPRLARLMYLDAMRNAIRLPGGHQAAEADLTVLENHRSTSIAAPGSAAGSDGGPAGSCTVA